MNNKGQTLGKKLMKIKVNSLNGDLTMNQLVVRSLLVNSILLNMIQVIIVSFINDSMVYFYVDLFFESVQYLFIFISVILIMDMFIDIKAQIIPNGLNFVGFIVGIVYMYIKLITNVSEGLDLLFGMFVGGGIFLLIALFALFAYKKEGLSSQIFP